MSREQTYREALEKIAEMSYIQIPAPILRLKEMKRIASEALASGSKDDEKLASDKVKIKLNGNDPTNRTTK